MAVLNSMPEGDVRVVRFNQARVVDQSTIDQVTNELKEITAKSAGGKLLLNFEGVLFVSSVVLGRLIAIHKTCKADHTDMRMCNVSSELLDIIKIMNLHKVFTIEADQEKAIASYNKKKWFLS